MGSIPLLLPQWLDGVSDALAYGLRWLQNFVLSPLRPYARAYAYRRLRAFASLSMARSVGYDVSQTRNVSQSGMLLMTGRAFAPGDRLATWVRLPYQGLPRLMVATVEALGSREIVRSLVYETRVQFVDLDSWSFQIMEGFCAETGGGLAPA